MLNARIIVLKHYAFHRYIPTSSLVTTKSLPQTSVAWDKRNVPLCICWYHFSAALLDNERSASLPLFPPCLPLPIYLLVPWRDPDNSTRREILVVTVRCHLVICQRPREKSNGRASGRGWTGENRRDAQWIKNEDKSVCPRYRCCRADGNAGKFGREARRSSLEQ